MTNTKKAIWLFENINQTNRFYNELNVLMLIASIISWKKHNNTFNELHCDTMSFLKLQELGVLSLWDNVDTRIVDTKTNIDTVNFWASSKNRVLVEQDECVSLVDVDLISYAPISNIGTEYPMICSHDEDGLHWYPSKFDEYIDKMTSLPKSLMSIKNPSAINVCYLSFNDFDLQKKYAQYSIKAMEELTSLNVPQDSKYMCWSEQRLLKHIIIKDKIKYKPLISNMYICYNGVFRAEFLNPEGEWTIEEANKKYYHIGTDKYKLRQEGADLEFLYAICRESVDIESIMSILLKNS
jgi:hypothetical protein